MKKQRSFIRLHVREKNYKKTLAFSKNDIRIFQVLYEKLGQNKTNQIYNILFELVFINLVRRQGRGRQNERGGRQQLRECLGLAVAFPTAY
jgi:hypothetical protein